MLKNVKYPPEPLTLDEVRALIGVCSPKCPTGIRNRALIVCLWRGGLRITEALSLEIRDLEDGIPRIRHGKGDKSRVVALDPEAWSDKNSEDQSWEVFISPLLKDSIEVAAVLVHELVHTAVGIECGHRGPFIHTADFVQKKGFQPKAVKAPAWISAAARCGIKTASVVLDGNETNGKQVLPATDAAIDAVNKVWSWLQQINMTQGKKKPVAACFRDIMKAGSETMGYYRDGMVYFKEDIATAVNKYLLQTAFEEVSHYVTGATDMSRDFQNFLIQCFVELAT